MLNATQERFYRLVQFTFNANVWTNTVPVNTNTIQEYGAIIFVCVIIIIAASDDFVAGSAK